MTIHTDQCVKTQINTLGDFLPQENTKTSITDEKIKRLRNEINLIKTIYGGFINPFTKDRLIFLGATAQDLQEIENARGRLLGGMLPRGPYNANGPSNNNPPPEQQGIYRIVNQSGSVVYVGETKNLSQREYQHEGTGKLKPGETFEWKTLHGNTSTETRRNIETEVIHENDNPIRNQVKLK